MATPLLIVPWDQTLATQWSALPVRFPGPIPCRVAGGHPSLPTKTSARTQLGVANRDSLWHNACIM